MRRLRHRLGGLVLVVAWGLGASCNTQLGDECDSDDDCESIRRQAICYPLDMFQKICVLACDVEMTFCARVEGETCVEMRTTYRPNPFADDDCDNRGGECQLVGPRTVCF